MTCPPPDPAVSTFDLPLEHAADRIAGLRLESARSRLVSSPPGVVDRVRDGVGRGLIALGSAIRPAGRARRRPVVSR